MRPIENVYMKLLIMMTMKKKKIVSNGPSFLPFFHPAPLITLSNIKPSIFDDLILISTSHHQYHTRTFRTISTFHLHPQPRSEPKPHTHALAMATEPTYFPLYLHSHSRYILSHKNSPFSASVRIPCVVKRVYLSSEIFGATRANFTTPSHVIAWRELQSPMIFFLL